MEDGAAGSLQACSPRYEAAIRAGRAISSPLSTTFPVNRRLPARRRSWRISVRRCCAVSGGLLSYGSMSGIQHAACPPPGIFLNDGSLSAHIGFASGHRVRNRHPEGGLIGEGISLENKPDFGRRTAGPGRSPDLRFNSRYLSAYRAISACRASDADPLDFPSDTIGSRGTHREPDLQLFRYFVRFLPHGKENSKRFGCDRSCFRGVRRTRSSMREPAHNKLQAPGPYSQRRYRPPWRKGAVTVCGKIHQDRDGTG